MSRELQELLLDAVNANARLARELIKAGTQLRGIDARDRLHETADRMADRCLAVYRAGGES